MSEPESKPPEPRFRAEWLAIGMALGAAFGTTFGVVFDNLALGIPFGMSAGISLGTLFALPRRTPKGSQDENGPREG